MGLPWFGLNIKDFIANTTRLNTEAKGAYLMLLLDYYEQEEGPPDDDEVLATITGLSIATWQRHAKVIRPLFSVVNGRLYQQRTVEEIAKGHARHSSSMKGVEAAAAARAARKGLPPPPDTKKTREDHRPSSSEDDHQESSRSTHKHKHSIEKKEGAPDVAPARAPESEAEEKKEALQEEGLLPADFAIPGSKIITYQSDGYVAREIAEVLDSFKRYHEAAGTFSPDWQGSWDKWWERKKPALVVKAKPRIEVTKKIAKPIPPDWTPNAGHHELALDLGLKCREVEDIFRDYCASSGKKYIDHDAAFRGFLRNQPNFNRGKPNGKAPGPDRSIVNAAVRRDADLDREIAALEAGQPDGGDPVLGVPEGGLRQPGHGDANDGDGA